MYFDDFLFEKSSHLIVKAAYLHYVKSMPQNVIAKQLNISTPTVSRLLKLARKRNIVKFNMDQDALDCIELENMLCSKLSLREAIVFPQGKQKKSPEALKKGVAMEAARYIQRVVKADDILGIASGGTMYYVVNYLMPSQKLNASFVMLHGNLANIDDKFNASTLTIRCSMAFGGKAYYIHQPGLQGSVEELQKSLQQNDIQCTIAMYEKITISVSGVGVFSPENGSPLATTMFLNKDEILQLSRLNTCGDFLMRFFDENGNECDSSLRKRVLAIEYDIYRNIHTKILAASGVNKTRAVKTLCASSMVDILIVDQQLAQSLCA
jgi:DNA-binding transcriptional regulator LsrR (DeoR family)